MMRTLISVASVLAIVVSTNLASIQSAVACTCSASTFERQVDQANIIVVGKLRNAESDGDAVFSVDQYLKGDGPADLTISNPAKTRDKGGDCSAETFVNAGDTLLFLKSDGTLYTHSYCGELDTVPVHFASSAQEYEAISDYVATGVSPSAGNQSDEASDSDKDLPVAIILPLAFLVPIGILVLFSLIKPRGGGH